MQTVMCVLIVNSNFKSDGLHLRPLDEAFPKFGIQKIHIFFTCHSSFKDNKSSMLGKKKKLNIL